MKEENKSWKDIAAEVGASKKDVQNRYKELMKSGDGEKKDEDKTEEKKGEDAWEPLSASTWINEDAADKDKDKDEFDFSNLFGDDLDDNPGFKKKGGKYWDNSPMDTSGKKDGGKTWDTASKKDGGNTRDTASKKGGRDSWETSAKKGGDDSWGNSTKKDDGVSTWDAANKNDKSSNGDGGKKQKGGNNKNKNNAKQQNNNNSGSGFGNHNQNQNQDGHGFGNSGNPGSGSGNGGGNNTNARDPFADPPEEQEGYKSRLQADDVWTERDCLILEYLEAQHRENKWLEIQSSFFNYTNRMIPGFIIEQKFRDDGAI